MVKGEIREESGVLFYAMVHHFYNILLMHWSYYFTHTLTQYTLIPGKNYTSEILAKLIGNHMFSCFGNLGRYINVLIFHCCITNYHTFGCSKHCPFIIYNFCASKVQAWINDILCSESQNPKSRCWLVCILIWKLWRKICFQAGSGGWPNLILYSGRTEIFVSLVSRAYSQFPEYPAVPFHMALSVFRACEGDSPSYSSNLLCQ